MRRRLKIQVHWEKRDCSDRRDFQVHTLNGDHCQVSRDALDGGFIQLSPSYFRVCEIKSDADDQRLAIDLQTLDSAGGCQAANRLSELVCVDGRFGVFHMRRWLKTSMNFKPKVRTRGAGEMLIARFQASLGSPLCIEKQTHTEIKNNFR